MQSSLRRFAAASVAKLRAVRDRGDVPTAPAEADARTDEEFLEATYEELLGRPVDDPGRAHYLASLQQGMARDEIVAALRGSDEYLARQRTQLAAESLPDLRESDPGRYTVERSVGGDPFDVYVARDAGDFDWIDDQIAINGYYEQPGMWTLGVDLDKQVMAELLSLLAPKRTIEFGCSSGAVIAGLLERGLDAHGIEISEFAKEHATAAVRDRIHLGDVRSLTFDRPFDTAFGLDIFEHINPNHLDAVIASFSALIEAPGLLFANLPAFGDDPVFGEVFEMFLPSWAHDAANGRLFEHLQVDGRGFPMHGHLVWASSDWWVARFEARGLRREPEIEAALHECYDWYFEQASPARKSFYVFSIGDDPARRAEVLQRARAFESVVLGDVRREWRAAGLVS